MRHLIPSSGVDRENGTPAGRSAHLPPEEHDRRKRRPRTRVLRSDDQIVWLLLRFLLRFDSPLYSRPLLSPYPFQDPYPRGRVDGLRVSFPKPALYF